MNEREREARLDLFAFRYLEAIQAGDLDAVDMLWAEADEDPELETLLHEVNDVLATEMIDQAHAEAAVTAAVEQHMPSAKIIRPSAGPLTVGDVAEDIHRAPPGALTVTEMQMNDVLRGRREPVPEQLALRHVIAWGSQFGQAPESYWKAFRQTALKLRMQRASESNYQVAARPAPPKPPKGTL